MRVRVPMIVHSQCPSLSLGYFYLAAFSWSAMMITGSGEVGFYPSQDGPETVIVTVLIVLGALMWARVLATFCDLATNYDPSAVEYRQALDDLNRFCREHGLANELKQRLRQYFHQRKHVMLAKSSSNVIHKSHARLRIGPASDALCHPRPPTSPGPSDSL